MTVTPIVRVPAEAPLPNPLPGGVRVVFTDALPSAW
jgi:hypothetical protein